MMYHILLDIDHTLYDYNHTHQSPLNKIGSVFQEDFQLPAQDFFILYKKARDWVHANLAETAAAHHRLLYFQKLFESLGVNSLQHAYRYYDLYWTYFIEQIV